MTLFLSLFAFQQIRDIVKRLKKKGRKRHTENTKEKISTDPLKFKRHLNRRAGQRRNPTIEGSPLPHPTKNPKFPGNYRNDRYENKNTLYMAGTVRTRIDREGVGIRPFPPTAYPPPSSWSPRREGKKETWTEIKQKERGGGEGGRGGGGGRRDATRRRIVCDFVLPLAATSRSRSSISHTSVPSRGRRPRRDRTRVHTYACTECVCVCVCVSVCM